MRKKKIHAARLNSGPMPSNLSAMLVGERIRAIREAKDLSQGDIEQRSGLLRCYTSRIENGHTVPSLETLEKFARALEVPLYQLFYAGTSHQNARGCYGPGLLIACGGVGARRRASWSGFAVRLPA